MQTTRLFEIIYTLLNKKTATIPAKELAMQFGVSTRTIYRDIDALSLAGIPIYTEKGKHGGISLLPDFVLNKSLLSEKEQSEIISALQGLQAVKAVDTSKILQKLSAVFNKNATPKPWLDIDFTNWSFSQENIFQNSKTGILENKIVAFEYYDAHGNKTSRRIEPIQLWFKSGAWYLKGYCLTKESVRTFKTSRIRNLILTEEHFQERDISSIPAEESQPNRHRPDVTIKLKIAPEKTFRVYEEFPCGELQPDGSHIVTVTWPEDEWVYGFLLSFGEYAEVLEPEHLREIVQEKARKIFAMYG